ncbi:MAG TPA: Zn-ribbon domain-containing OB-fold protein [Candidatus Eisenbacteria bacterium]|jgi:uncharacterized OB-fold protein
MFKWFGIVNLSPATRVAEFAEHLRGGRLMAARCRTCGLRSFPPRADCARCLSPEFDWVEIDGRCRLLTWSRIAAAPHGFEHLAPYTVAVVDLDEGGRALAWLGSSVPEETLRIGMPLRLVPRLHEDVEDIRVDYTLEDPGHGAVCAGAPVSAGETPLDAAHGRRSGR